jgi:hypothetical protein
MRKALLTSNRARLRRRFGVCVPGVGRQGSCDETGRAASSLKRLHVGNSYFMCMICYTGIGFAGVQKELFLASLATAA